MNYFQLIKYGDAVISKVDSKLLYSLSQSLPCIFLFLIKSNLEQGKIIEQVQGTLIYVSQSVIFSTGILLYLLLVFLFFFKFRKFQMSEARCLSKNKLIFIQQFTLIQQQINNIQKFPLLLLIGIHINQISNFNNFHFFCDFLLMLIQFMLSISYIILTTSILNLRKRSFKLLHLELLSGFIGYLIRVAIALCTGYIIGEQNKLLRQELTKVVSILNIFNSAIIFYSILITQIYQNISQIKIALIIHSFSLLYAIEITFNLQFQNAITILIAIFISQISNRYIIKIFYEIILKPTKMLKKHEQSQSIFQKFNLQLTTQQLLIYKASLLTVHRKNCEDLKCSCRYMFYQNDIRVILKDDVYLEQRIRYLKSININSQTLEIPTFCHYLSAFYICQDYVSISILICKNKILENLETLRIDQQVQWEVFYYLMRQEIFKQSMQNINTEYKDNQQRFTNMVQMFFRNQSLFKEVKKLSFEIIENKLQLLNEILSPNASKFYELYEQKMKSITENLQQLEKQINRKQDQNSDPKFNQLLLFIHGNILNNWQLAQKGKKKLNTIIKTHQLTFGSKDFNLQYIIFNYDLLVVTFNHYSQGIPSILGYSKEQFKQLKYLEEITPILVGQIHVTLINKFFKTGKSNYYRRRNSILCKQADGTLKSIQLSFDVEQKIDSIQIITYITPQIQQHSVIIVDNNGIIVNCSQEFKDMINFIHGQSWELNNLRCKSKNNQEYNLYFFSAHRRNQEYTLNCDCHSRQTYKIIYIFSINNYSFNSTYTLTNKDEIPEEDDVIQKPYDEYQLMDTQIKIDLQHVVQKQQLMEERNQYIEQQNNVSESNVLELMSKISSENVNFDSEKNKKALLLNQLVNQSKTGNNINNLIRFILLAVACQICQIIIGVSNMFSDLRICNYYFEYVQIDHYIIEPISKFTLAKLTIQNYYILQEQEYFTQEEYQFYVSFTNENIIKQYFKLKNNFEIYFADKQLQKYIFSDQILIKQQIVHNKPVQVEEEEVSINVAFSILLEGFYKQYLLYAQGKTVSSSSPYQTYEVVNQISFIRYFEDLSNKFFDSAIIEIETIVQRLINQLIILNFIFLILSIFMAIFLLKHKKSIEKIMNLRRFINPLIIKQDMELLLDYKLKVLNQHLINVKYPCQSLQEQASSKNKFTFNTNLKNIRIPYIKILLFLLLIWSYLFGFTYLLTLKSISHLKTFPHSITLLKLISDVNVHLPASYAQIEILYNWSRYPYLTDEDFQGILEEFEETIIKLDHFMNLQMSQDTTQLSKQEIDYLNLQFSGNLCEILDENEYVNFKYFCTNSYNGLLKFGALQTIAYLTDQIELEIENNFTTRSVPVLQLEGVYLCTDAVTLLTDSMHRDILNEGEKYKYFIVVK